jgi:PKD repeat protein
MAAATAAVAVASACTLKSQEAPPLTGPSELGQSVAISVTPDVLPQDGASQSFVTITVRDANAQPIRNLGLRMETRVKGTPVDFGVLSAKSVVTGSDGRASVVYTAPPSPFASSDPFILVDVVVTPLGTDYYNTNSRSAAIRLVPQGTTIPPNILKAEFTMSPTAPTDHQRVLFDASASTPQSPNTPELNITEYRWEFGDGERDSGRTVDHDYELPGTYVVRLTVVDRYGNTNSTSKSLTVTASSTKPTAVFAILPNPAKANTTVTFDASASRTTADARIEKYTWDFGDGTWTTTTGPVATRSFPAVGAYPIKLFVTDSAGRVSDIVQLSATIIP